MGGVVDEDKIEITNPGLVYTVPDDTWTINDGIVVSSRDTDGVFSNQSGSTLINNGNIFAGAVAVYFSGGDSDITNNGNIAGFGTGIVISGNGAAIINHGTVFGYTNIGILFDTSREKRSRRHIQRD